jgi:UDP-N-acetylmuramoylalanine--D-glutamate ligase
MIVPEHLNWHPGMGEYTEAKGNIFKFQNSGDRAVFHAKNQYSKQIAQLSKGTKLPYLVKPGAWVDGEVIRYDQEEVCKVSDVALIGPHNLENICAAITAVWEIIGDPQPIRSAISGFSGLEHRLELVVEAGGVKYYNDSFSTTPETAIAAIQAFNQPKVIILGGSDKGSDYTALAAEIADANIRQVILVGDTKNPRHNSASPLLAKAFKDQGITKVKSLIRDGGSTMDEVVATAAKVVKTGDIVLLSPACASFDMFTGYKQRGEQFREAVAKLAAAAQ